MPAVGTILTMAGGCKVPGVAVGRNSLGVHETAEADACG